MYLLFTAIKTAIKHRRGVSAPGIIAVILLCSTLLPMEAGFTQTNACMAQGNSLSEARSAYAVQCQLPRVDCDPVGSVWVCSSEALATTQSPVQFFDQPVSTSSTGTTSGTASSTERTRVQPLSRSGFPDVGSRNGAPICLTDTNSINGYGFENGRSCVVVPGVTSNAVNPLLGTRICSPWMEIGYDQYVVQNNVWNSSAVFNDSWSQCIELGGSTGNYVARWDYNWLDREQGDEYAVKSYPQVYYGRKTQYHQSGTVAETGFPALINQLPAIQVDFRYSETGNPERNVALESFLHNSCETTDNNKFFEMMVWVDKPTIRTPGSLLTTANIDGRVWDVYTNPQLTWGYVAFVAQQPITQASLNWNAFIDWSRFQGPAFGVPPTGDNTCLGAVEFGTETFWGNGTFTLESFDVLIGS